MVDASTGWALVVPPGESVDPFGERSLFVARTTDRGATWTVFPRFEATDSASALWVSSTLALVTVTTGTQGAHVRVDRTTDGGRRWTRTKLPLPPTAERGPNAGVMGTMFSPDGARVHVELDHGMSSQYGYGFSTKDHGATWTLLPGGGFRMREAPAPGPRGATIVSEATTASGRRFRVRELPGDAGDDYRFETSDDGKAWSPVALGSDVTVTSGALFFESTGCVVAGDRVICTSDGGTSWRTIHIDSDHRIRQLAAPPRPGWVVLYTDTGVRSLRATDNGSWTAQDVELSHRKDSLLEDQSFQLLTSDVALCAIDGVLYETTNGGRTFSPVPVHFSDEAPPQIGPPP